MGHTKAFVLASLALAAPLAGAADLPYVNWENHPVHALDLSPDGRTLAVAHTADQRVQLFDVSSGAPLPLGHVVVGVDPVSVRFRTAGELWVVNRVSDSVSVVDVPNRRVRATLATLDEPADLVFAGARAFVSCSQANRVQVFDAANPGAALAALPILGERPRALAASADGREVYVAIFESGNASTLLAGGLLMSGPGLPNVVSDTRGPYGGTNPPPNAGTVFDPPVNPAATPPRVGLIVKKRPDQKWFDDNQHDWTPFVSGELSSASGRVAGWDLADRDLAIVDTATLSVRYVSGLMNIVMALAVNPASGEVDLVGTDAANEVRFEPNVNSRFVRVPIARVQPASGAKTTADLNPQIAPPARSVAQDVRDQALGDPRALVWRPDGQRGWVAGLGSNNVIPLNANGTRAGAPIAVGQGPAGLALDAARNRLYVWNHFDATLSVLDANAGTELARVPAFNPLPQAIRAGRPFLYDTHRTSGLGQAACASCHVDARNDRLAWDLGDPAAPPRPFDQNCGTQLGQVTNCQPFQGMKGPMTTQTLVDIIGNEPFHWRGDRAGIEAFNPAFHSLLGDDVQLTPAEMQAFEDFLATLSFPPNPYRNFDNTLPGAIALEGQYTSGRFALPGLPLGTGNAQRGLELYTRGLLDAPFQCASCHTLPTGMAVNGPFFLGNSTFSSGGTVMLPGPFGENHLGIVSVDGSTNVSIKVPQLRNEYQKTGFYLGRTDSTAGFGVLHDGSVDTLPRFMSARAFSVQSDQDVADLVALMLAFSGSDFGPIANPLLSVPPPVSRDTRAAVGAQITLAGGEVPARAAEMIALAQAATVDLVVHAGTAGWFYDAATSRFLASDGSAPATPAALQALSSNTQPQTWIVVPLGLGRRLGIDRDGDGVGDAAELKQGSNPADAESKTLRPSTGLWYDPNRSGHGFDVQRLGNAMFATWYTYDDQGAPTWYQAVGDYANPWVATMNRFTWNPATGKVVAEPVGELKMTFDSAQTGTVDWRIGTRTGSEPIQRLVGGTGVALPDHGGTWYDPHESGWGISEYEEAATRVAIVYFYDAANQPRWTLGQDGNAGATSIPMRSFKGFCPDCAKTAITSTEAGQIALQFGTARAATLATGVFDAASPNAPWQRGPVPVVPISEPAAHYELN